MKKSILENKDLKKSPFKIPEGYFESVEEAVFSEITTDNFVKQSGFKTPESYFNKLEEQVLGKLSAQKSSEGSGFGVPDGYFSSLEDKVLGKINEPGKQVKVISMRSILLKRVLPIAAAASLLLILYLNNNQDNNQETTSLDNVALTDIEQWIESDLLTFDSYELAEVYSDIDLEEESTLTEEDQELLEYIDGMDIESVLLEN